LNTRRKSAHTPDSKESGVVVFAVFTVVSERLSACGLWRELSGLFQSKSFHGRLDDVATLHFNDEVYIPLSLIGPNPIH
jgi:hypothetical protein